MDDGTRADAGVRAAAATERLFNLSLDLLAVADFEGRLVQVNPTWTASLGWSTEELVGRPWIDFVHPEDHAITVQFAQTLLDGLPVRAFENRYLHKDGSSRWLSWNALAIPEARQIFGVGRDITAQRQERDRQRQNERLLRMAGETARLGGWVVDLADGQATWSDEVCDIHEVPHGFRPSVKTGIAFYAPESRAEISRVVAECIAHGTPFAVELEIITARGNRRGVCAMGEAVRDAADRIVQLQGAFQDITDRRRAEAALRASEARFRTVVQSSWDVFHLVGPDGTILYESPAVTRVLGYQPEEMVGRCAFDFIHPDDLPDVSRTPDVLPPSGGSHIKTLRIRHKDGRWRWIESYEVNLTDNPDVRAFAVNYRDVTERMEAEASLRASEERFRAVANSMSQLAWIAEADGAIYWYNQRWYEYTGTTPADMAGWGWQAVHHPERLPTAMAAWKAAIASGTPLELEFPLRGADGVFRTFLTRVVPVRDAGGRVVQWFGTNTDVDALKRVEASLRESESRLKAAQRIAGLGSWDWDLLTGELRWSEEVYRLFGISPDAFEATYEAFLRGVHPDDRERTHSAAQDALAGIAPYVVEHRTLAPDGTVRTLLEQGEVTRDAAGRPVHMAGTVLDVTQRKLAEFHLAETNRALHLLSRCNEAVIRSETEDELLESVCRIAVAHGGARMAWVGYAEDDDARNIVPRAHAGFDDGYLAGAGLTWSAASALGRGPGGRAIRQREPVVVADLRAEPTCAPWLEAADARGFRGVVALPLEHASVILGVLVLYQPEVRVLQAQELRVLRDLADDLAFGIVNLRDRVERRRLQAALQKMATSVSASTGTQFFEQLAASMADALGADAAFVARAPGTERTARVIAGVVDGRGVPAFELELAGTPGERVLALEECMVAATGADVFGRAAPHAAHGTRAYAGRRLDDSTGQPLGLAFALFHDPVRSPQFVASTLQIFATRAAAELERQKAEVRLREQASLLDKAQDAILVRDLDHRVLFWNQSAERRYGWTAAEAVGRSVRDLIYHDPTEFDLATAATLARGEWVGELHQRRKDGAPVAVEGRWTLVRDDDGVPRSILAVNTDLTERKKLERTEDQLRHAQKMEAIGSLAGGIAHDFNNLLSVILSYTELILADLPAADPLAADMLEVKQAGLRATELTRRLLAFSRKQILEPVVLDLNQVVSGVVKMLGRLLGEHIALTTSTAAVASRVYADPSQIEQVLMNLVVNARDAMPNGGTLTIETADAELDETYAAEHIDVTPGRYVMLAVSDTGQGMDRATQERIFEPFFTTKDKSKGTGLGLSTVYGIVQQSGGHIWVYSEPGVGTSFKVYLPRSDRDVAPATHSVTPGSSLRGSETILLVEDEEQVRTILRTILRRQGYNVLEAQNGGEAFLTCEQFPAKIHLMLTDVVMPRMSGRQLAERLGPLRPNMKILYMSGYTEDTIVHHGVLDAGIEFLAKPIMPEALLRKVRSVLGPRG